MSLLSYGVEGRKAAGVPRLRFFLISTSCTRFLGWCAAVVYALWSYSKALGGPNSIYPAAPSSVLGTLDLVVETLCCFCLSRLYSTESL